MAAYTTYEQLASLFGSAEMLELTDRDRDGTPDILTYQAAIEAAGAEIDSYLATRYDVPIDAPVPAIIGQVASDIVRYRLYDDAAPEEVRQRYEDARRWLQDAAKGLVCVNVVPPSEGGEVVACSHVYEDRLFSSETLADF